MGLRCKEVGLGFTGVFRNMNSGMKNLSAKDRLGLIFCYILITIAALYLFLKDIGQSVGVGLVTSSGIWKNW